MALWLQITRPSPPRLYAHLSQLQSSASLPRQPPPLSATAPVFSEAPAWLPPPTSDGTLIHYLFPQTVPFPQPCKQC